MKLIEHNRSFYAFSLCRHSQLFLRFLLILAQSNTSPCLARACDVQKGACSLACTPPSAKSSRLIINSEVCPVCKNWNQFGGKYCGGETENDFDLKQSLLPYPLFSWEIQNSTFCVEKYWSPVTHFFWDSFFYHFWSIYASILSHVWSVRVPNSCKTGWVKSMTFRDCKSQLGGSVDPRSDLLVSMYLSLYIYH